MSSILGRQSFTELFLRRSCALPKLLVAYIKGSDVFFFSAPQPKDEKPSPVVANYVMKVSFDAYFLYDPFCLSKLDHGLMSLYGTINSAVCNPSTGQSLTVPNLKTESTSLFGYDPIDKQVKVLSMWGPWVSEVIEIVAEEYQVMTLGTENPSWRTIDCGRKLRFCKRLQDRHISGVLYYTATDMSTETSVLVCFDVRSEKFSFIKVEEFVTKGTMINCDGKLGFIRAGEYACACKTTRVVNLWVLEDIEKQESSEHTFVLPSMWKGVVGNAVLRFVGMTGTNEIVMEPLFVPPRPLYLLYFNIERNTVVRVVENVKLL